MSINVEFVVVFIFVACLVLLLGKQMIAHLGGSPLIYNVVVAFLILIAILALLRWSGYGHVRL